MAIKMKLPDSEKAMKYFDAKMQFTTGPAELKHLMDEGKAPVIIDVRATEDYREGHIPGAISVPKNEWKDCKALKKGQLNVVYCYTVVCHLAAQAALYFASKGFPVVELDGGFQYWKKYGYEIEKGAEEEEKEARAA